MTDEILSINTDTLDGIANAIRSKGGLSQSNKLSFPDGMVSALQNIETVATVTPKVSPPSTVELTPSDTSFALEPGYHTNGTSVFINATAGSATPSSTEQTYYPPSPYNFFSSFWVNGIGNAKKMVSGSVTASGGTSLTIPGFDFMPEGALLILNNSTGRPPNKTCLSVVYAAGADIKNPSIRFGYTSGILTSGYGTCSPSYGTVTFNGRNDISYFNGTYQYVLWGS